MNFTNTRVTNFEGAFRGLRNPLNSWSKSDSRFGLIDINDTYHIALEIADKYLNKQNISVFDEEYDKLETEKTSWLINNGIISAPQGCVEYAFLGPNDLNLAQRMICAGASDSKFLRQIFVSVDITAPMYWWSEADTYKIATVANSTSKMHKLASTPITLNCFELDDYIPDILSVDKLIAILEELRQKYVETKDKRYWKELIRWLPESWLQTRTWTCNYTTLRNIYFQRQNHKLTEWHSFCRWVEDLPYARELILTK